MGLNTNENANKKYEILYMTGNPLFLLCEVLLNSNKYHKINLSLYYNQISILNFCQFILFQNVEEEYLSHFLYGMRFLSILHVGKHVTLWYTPI
jgi:hypothetical protein